MSSRETPSPGFRHVVAMPYPGRGHINPMMNLCKVVAGKSKDILITVVVTEEWLSLIGSDAKPENIRLATIPNVVPSERVRGEDIRGFVLAVWTKMEEPFERVLDRIQPRPTMIVADSFLPWVGEVAEKRNIRLAFLWGMSATVFSVFYHFELLVQHHHFPANPSAMHTANGGEVVDYIPGLPATRLADLPTIVRQEEDTKLFLDRIINTLPKAKYLIFSSIYGLESTVIEASKLNAPFQIYNIGPSTLHYKIKELQSSNISQNDLNYMKWLNLQPPNSVLFVSLGSFHSVSDEQMDEIAAGLCSSGVRFLWVARGENMRLEELSGKLGFIVQWCDQLSVLCHPSVGGFWTHCGWNSTKEAVLAGVPLLVSPIMMDQIPNSKMVVEDWKVGWRLTREFEAERVAKRDEIAMILRRFMDLESADRKELTESAKQLQQICDMEFKDGQSFDQNLNDFTKNIMQNCSP